jgi:hypothetical protein
MNAELVRATVYLARLLTELHGETITAHRDGPGRGTTFVRLPLRTRAIEDHSVVPLRRPQERTSLPRDVLVVDHNRDAVESLGTALRLSGHRAYVAVDGYRSRRGDTELCTAGGPRTG